MAQIRSGTTAVWGQIPKWGSTEAMWQQQSKFAGNSVVSANLPMVYQVIWSGTDVNESYIPTVSGDIVNVIFNVLGTTQFPTPALTADWDLIGSIKKSRDIPNTNIVNNNEPASHSFTVDVSRMVADQLSYSLVPIGKGSWMNTEFGGMNGGAQKQDNITESISPYNVTRNGAYRSIRVKCTIEMLNANGEIELSTSVVTSAPYVRAINSAPNFSSNTYLNQMRSLLQWTPDSDSPARAMTNSPNVTLTTTDTPSYKKPVSLSDEAEFLYFYASNTFNGSDQSSPDYYNLYEVFVKTYNAAGSQVLSFVLGSEYYNSSKGVVEISSDISHSFNHQTASGTTFAHAQNQICVQNISPAFIADHAYTPQNANYPYTSKIATPIGTSVTHYRVYVRGNYYSDAGAVWTQKRASSVYWYSINREEENPVYENVRFHWLNTAGGIDSYTARRNVLESISSSKSVMETKLPSRYYMQSKENAAGTEYTPQDYHNDGMRGWNTYQGGTEVLSVDAKINNSVYTEPLSALESKWLREIFQSPNVWIEDKAEDSGGVNYKADAPYHMHKLNPLLRPSQTIYKPVIITNSEVVSLDQEKGLVMYNIEYTHSQGILTQRN